jgi:hypothetical protein
MSNIIHPDRIANSLELVAAKTIPAIIKEYEEAYRYGFDRRDREPISNEERAAEGHKGKSGLAGDPTGDIVIEQNHVRNVLRSVGKKLDHAAKDLVAIQTRLSDLFVPDDEDDHYVPLRSLTPGEDKKNPQPEATRNKRKREIVDEIERHRRAITELTRELHGGAA